MPIGAITYYQHNAKLIEKEVNDINDAYITAITVATTTNVSDYASTK